MLHILVIEDEPTLRQLITDNLTFEGFSVAAVGDGNLALEELRRRPANLIVLDLMLPRLDGFQVLHLLRQSGDTVPVLMLTARGSEDDRIRGLHLGADDYLVKPFSILELIARIHAILRRTQGSALGASSLSALRTGPFLVNRLRKQVYLTGRSLNLTALEFHLVEILAANPGIPFSREELLKLAWGEEEIVAPRTLNVHIANLRKKLAEGGPQEWIVTVGRVGRGGYFWSAETQPEHP